MGKLTLLNVLLQSQVFFLLLVTILDATDKVKVNWKIKKKKKKERKRDALIFDTPKLKAVSMANFTNKPYYYYYYYNYY